MAAPSRFVVASAMFLQDYGGREKVMRTLTYLSLMLSGLSKNNANSKKLLTISAQLGLCRTMLRLFDDLPMLAYTLSYGWGCRERSTFLQVLGVVKNAVDQAFFPLEHIAWAADNKIINVPSGKWWILSITAWLTSLTLGILKASGSLVELEGQRRDAIKQAKSSQDGRLVEARELTRQQTLIAVGIMADACDLCNAVNWMPAGFLWSGKLPDRWIGLFGTISSLMKLGLLIESRK